MKKEEINNYVENIIDDLCNESGLTREEVLWDAAINCIEYFYRDNLSKEELINCAEYLGYELDIDEIEKEKAKRQKRKEARKKRAIKSSFSKRKKEE